MGEGQREVLLDELNNEKLPRPKFLPLEHKIYFNYIKSSRESFIFKQTERRIVAHKHT